MCREAGIYLEVIIILCCIFSLRVRSWSELQSARVDVETSMFCGERRWNQLVILRSEQTHDYC